MLAREIHRPECVWRALLAILSVHQRPLYYHPTPVSYDEKQVLNLHTRLRRLAGVLKYSALAQTRRVQIAESGLIY